MSSRSLAAARSRRSGDNVPPVSGNRPGTSIGSHAAFSPQQQTPPGYNHNMQPNNVRVEKGQPKSSTYQQVKQSHQQTKNGLPFAKLSISDAIGLITLRLGRVEQWVIETEHENENNENNENNHNTSSIGLPDNSKIIDNSFLASILNRLETVEKIGPSSGVNDNNANDVVKLTDQITRIVDEGVKQRLAITKHTEQLFKFERELVETKDILKTFMIKYDLFTSDTNDRFSDFEVALTELENNVKLPEENVTIDETAVEIEINDAPISGNNLKNIVQQELLSA